ncbi:MAG: hypothetical protein AAGB00_07660 [Planctomycetota bacterium]
MKGDDVTNTLGFCVRSSAWVGVLCALATGGTCPAAAPILHFGSEPLRQQLVTSEKTDNNPNPLLSNAIYREVPRQMVMLVAREEFGLSTRDEALLEPVNRQSEHFFRLDAPAWFHKSITLKVSHRGEEIYACEVKARPPSIESVYHAADRFYAQSRAPLIKVFEEAGYKRKADRKAAESTPLPDQVGAWLLTMDHPTQFRAVREIHRLIREEGESAARLSGLVRGYANLSQLTMYTFDARSDAFAARALLYSERLAALAPDSPESGWSAAYMSTLIGYPTWTIKAMKAAKELCGADGEPPEWAALVDAYSRYQTGELTSVAIDEEHPLRGLAALLWFRASMHSNSFSVMAETGREVMRAIPNCLWVVDALAERAGVSYGHMIHRYAPRAHAEQLAHVLADWPGLPDEAAGLVGGRRREPHARQPRGDRQRVDRRRRR